MSDNVSGEATKKATSLWAEKIMAEKGWQFSILGRTNFKVSPAGFGCYRIDHKSHDHHKALYMSLKEGINLIDTSTNYSLGGSEILVGKVLKDAIKEGLLKRDDVVIVSKIGYAQGPAMEVAREKIKNGTPFSDMVYYSEDCWHCIHPDFLEDQFERSLKRLDMEKLDILLLHNPEYFLSLSHKNGSKMEQSREEYYSRIEKAFQYLEELVKKGKISWYGISSNTFPTSDKEFEHTSLEKIWNIACKISSNHHFAVIQFPANLYENGAMFNKNQKNETCSLLELAGELNLGVMINRPLNSYPENSLVRLSDFNVSVRTEESDVEKHFSKLYSLEDSIVKSIGEDEGGYLKNQLKTSKMLGKEWKFLFGLEHWNMVRYNYLSPQYKNTINLLRTKTSGVLAAKELELYIDELDKTMDSIANFYCTRAQEKSEDIHRKLNKFLPESMKNCSLSQKAVWMLRSLPSVSTVLVGMRRQSYVEDVIFGLKIKTAEDGAKLWKLWQESA